MSYFFDEDLSEFIQHKYFTVSIDKLIDDIDNQYKNFKKFLELEQYDIYENSMLIKFLVRCIGNRWADNCQSGKDNFRNPVIMVDSDDAYEKVISIVLSFFDNIEDNIFIQYCPMFGRYQTMFYINNYSFKLINFSKYDKLEKFIGRPYDSLYQTGLFYLYYNDKDDLEENPRYEDVKYSVQKGYRMKTDIFEYLDVETLK